MRASGKRASGKRADSQLSFSSALTLLSRQRYFLTNGEPLRPDRQGSFLREIARGAAVERWRVDVVHGLTRRHADAAVSAQACAGGENLAGW